MISGLVVIVALSREIVYEFDCFLSARTNVYNINIYFIYYVKCYFSHKVITSSHLKFHYQFLQRIWLLLCEFFSFSLSRALFYDQHRTIAINFRTGAERNADEINRH